MNQRKNIPWIHVVRLLACIMVICTHTMYTASFYPVDDFFTRKFDGLVYLATRPCVNLFFMITGFLILPYKEDAGVMDFYRKRIPRVLFPLLVWGVVYAWLPFFLGEKSLTDSFVAFVLSPIQQTDGILWYLFMLIGVYLAIPFLNAKIFTDDKYLRLYLWLWIASSVTLLVRKLIPYSLGVNPCEHSFDMLFAFAGYLGFLLSGYAVKKYGDDVVKFMTCNRIYGGVKPYYSACWLRL